MAAVGGRRVEARVIGTEARLIEVRDRDTGEDLVCLGE
jgi:hypothetical protein